MLAAPALPGHVIPTVPFPPDGGAMNPAVQSVFFTVLWAIAGVFVLAALRSWRRSGSPLPLLVLAGGALCVCIEPIVDLMGLCWFWPAGQHPLFEVFGRSIPDWMLPTYLFYVGGQTLYTMRWLERQRSVGGLFGLYALYALVNVLLEEPPLHFGLYTYYGAQPLKPLLLPLWWLAANAAMPITAGALLHLLKPHLAGWKLLLVVPLMPMADAVTNAAVAWPVWTALNSSDDLRLTTLAALLSLGQGLLLIWVLALAVTGAPLRASLRRPAAAAAAAPLGTRA